MKVPNSPKLSRRLFSKLREVWILHPSIIVGIICGVFFVLALVLFLIVCKYRGWDLAVVLTSPKAILLYVIGAVAVVIVLFRNVLFKRW